MVMVDCLLRGRGELSASMLDVGWNNTSSPHLGLIYESHLKNVSGSFDSGVEDDED
jgi:hypothetical protein